ncbi:hypothetical protein PFISCL1PPCAC_9442, partial [Pristionchus fissidentatus]
LQPVRMEEWESIEDTDSSTDAETIWACQSSALDHYERHPTCRSIQDNMFASSLGRNDDSNGREGKQRPNGITGEPLHLAPSLPDTTYFGKLIDVETPTSVDSSGSTSSSSSSSTLRLLARTCPGCRVRLRGGGHALEMETEKAPLEKGSLVRDVSVLRDDGKIIDYLAYVMDGRPGCVAVASTDTPHMYAVVSEVDLMRISADNVAVLRSVDVQNRYELYSDFVRLDFLCTLKPTDEVCYEETKGEMRRGFVESRERDDRGGYMYTVRVPHRDYPSSDDSRERRQQLHYDSHRSIPPRFYDDYEGNEHEGQLLYSSHRAPPDRLYAPVQSRGGGGVQMAAVNGRTRAPAEKIIPIQIVQSSSSNSLGGGSERREERYAPENYRSLSRDQTDRYAEPDRYQERPRGEPPKTLPRTNRFDFDLAESNYAANSSSSQPHSAAAAAGTRVTSSGEGAGGKWNGGGARETMDRGGGVREAGYAADRMMQQQQQQSQPRQPQQANGEVKRSTTVTTSMLSADGWQVGDRCAWTNEGMASEAIVRWIGRLRGHQSVYAGLEFDQPVGQGTGMYQGQELFKTPPDHAGFVMLNTISPLLVSTSSTAAHPASYQTQNQNRTTTESRMQPVQHVQSENGRTMRQGGAAPSASSFNQISYPVAGRVGNASPPRDVPLSGQGAMLPPSRYNGAEMGPSTSAGPASAAAVSARHRALPTPPPAYSAEKPVGPRHSPPPPVPPRPAMMPEDYMIESFDVGSCVDVCFKGAVRSGVVRWKGDALSESRERLETSVVVELETSELPPEGWRQSVEADILGVDHTLSTVLVPLTAVRRDRRFAKDSSPSSMANGSGAGGYGYEGGAHRGQDFGSIDSGVEVAKREPWGGTDELIGRMKGVQGHRNSCYLDSMLYALFVQCAAFDDILTRRRSDKDIKEYEELVRILSTEIVWPLRRFHYCRADHVMKLRTELEKALPNIKGLTSEEKDPEEILSALLRDVFKTRPYLNLINSKTGKVESTWLYHVVVDAEEWRGSAASSQHLLERSLRKDATKLAECPQVFIMQLPRYGVTKLFDKIVPLEKIDLTPFINNTVFACSQCQRNPAELYCHECYLTKEALYGEVSYCVACFRSVHMAQGLSDHADRPIPPPSKPSKKTIRHTFTLSAVLAIETSHYVSFVRSAQGRWLFFDSMADREGLQNGFNIPQVKECERVGSWLSLAGYQRLRAAPTSLPPDDPLVNRLLSDPYICIYTADQPVVTSSNPTTSLLSKLTKELKISKN